MLYTAKGRQARTKKYPDSIASLIRVSSVFQTESWPCGVIWLNSGLEGMIYFGLGSEP
jgi:hypothetical protein